MSAATNMRELEQMIMAEIDDAMEETRKQSRKNMATNLAKFYSVPEGSSYKRTGALRRTPRVTIVSSVGNASSFKFYLSKTHTYRTGKLLRQMSALLPAAETHMYGIRGRGGFWGRAVQETQRNFYSAMSKRFK